MLLFTNFSQELESVWQSIVSGSITLGGRIIAAMFILVIGKLIINWLNRLFSALMQRQKVEPSVQTFLKSTVNILLLVMLGVAVISKLGIEITGFAALLASAGVAIGVVVPAVGMLVDGERRIGVVLLDLRPSPSPGKVGQTVLLLGLVVAVDGIQYCKGAFLFFHCAMI